MNHRLVLFLLLIVAMVGVTSADTLLKTTGADGYSQRDSANSSFSTIRAATGNANSGTQTTTWVILSSASVPASYYSKQTITQFFINGSDLPDNAIIDSALLGIKPNARANALGNTNIVIINTSDTSQTWNDADYQKRGWVTYSDVIPYASFANGVYTNISFNSAGLASISKTGVFAFVLTTEWDSANTEPSVPAAGAESYIQFRAFEYTGTASDPYFEITYHLPSSAPVASFACTNNLVRIPNTVTCTDSSTNTPTSWSWNMGDGSAAVTTQNVNYAYTKRGMWGITMNATNAGGSNTTPSATNVRVVGYENYW